MARLMLATPDGQQVVELRAHNSLGRHPSNTLQLLDKIVSKEHCIIEQRGEKFVLRDLGSLNGTYVNAERVNGERDLHHGDEIALGSTRARFDDGTGLPVSMPQSPGAAPAQAGWQRPPASLGQPMSMQPQTAAAPSLNGPAGASSASPPPGQQSAPQPQPQMPQQSGKTAREPAVEGPGGTAAFAAIPAQPVAAPGDAAAQLPIGSTRVDVSDQDRAIGTQINANQQKFLPYDQIASNPQQLAADYERLRMSHELSREIALERDLGTLLNKILMSVFRFVRADRGVIFLMDSGGTLQPGASLRRDGTNAPIRVSSTIMNHVMKERATVLTHDAAMDFAASKGKSMILNRISSAIVAPLLHNDDILGIMWLDSETLAQFTAKDMEIVTSIAAQAAMFIEINILGKKIEQEIINRERFSRLLSPNVAERVISGELEVKKGGQLVQECTVFNSDIRGFTRMSEGAPPEQIVEMLNDYFEHMVETLFEFEGTLDKFMGDGIMALWGAPVAQPDDAVQCVSCALEMMEVLGRFNRDRLETEQPALAVGMGVHSGPLVAGYIGSSRALSYTVIGDTANTSARLCGVAQSGQIIVSQATLSKLENKFEYEELPPANLKGKEKPFPIYNIKGRRKSVQVPAAAAGS